MRPETIAAVTEKTRGSDPLVHCIVGPAVAQLVADGLLAAGARPLMTATLAEAPALVQGTDALLVNLGMLSDEATRAVLPTVATAREMHLPWVLDPVAVGPAPVRTTLALNLIRHRPTIVRGNASEVSVLAGGDGGATGPDSVLGSMEVESAAQLVAAQAGCTVAVSGQPDVITDGARVVRVHNGVPLLTRVTGTGCLLGALTAACSTVADPFDAALTATVWLTVAAEHAAATEHGPGSFRVALVDALHTLDATTIARQAKW